MYIYICIYVYIYIYNLLYIYNVYIYIYIIYYIKLKSRPSVRSFLVAWISAVDARIDVELTRQEAPNISKSF